MSSSTGPSSAFGQTLQFITTIKLQELEKQRLSYQEHAKVLQDACGNDLVQKFELLLDAVQSWPGSGSVYSDSNLGGKLNLANLNLWLKQAKMDPNFSEETLNSWIDTLETHIRHSMTRFDCAKLFGNLFNEWIGSGDSSTALRVDAGAEASADFEKLGRQEMYDQLNWLTSIIFDDADVDTDALERYLSDLFSGDEAAKAFSALRSRLSIFQMHLKRKTITEVTVKNLVRGLLASGLMDEAKRATLAEFLDSPTVLDEVASVLTMRMVGLESWTWPAEGMTIEMRRHLNGKYRCVWGAIPKLIAYHYRRAFTDTEIIDALLLQHIGISWQVKLKHAFRRVLESKAWKKTPLENKANCIAKELHQDAHNRDSIDTSRQEMRESHFFLSQLSSSARILSTYDDHLDTPSLESPDSPAAIKRKLLRIMATEAQLNSTLHTSHAVVRSDLEWFGPSLPHQSILTVLKFFGISEEWTSFFQCFLCAPLRFKGDASAGVCTRLRGMPISYALSVICGEVILFGMDFAVNQRADGLFLYRMHDDLWLWDADPAKCAVGWREMNVYADLVGLKFNASKTGSACIGTAVPAGLPAGDIRWGFLRFNQDKAWFVIDQKDVDLHIVELRRQLASTKSVFGWVNVYTTITWRSSFATLVVGPRRVLIQEELFPDAQGGTVAYLCSVIEMRFGIADLPQGYFYLPIRNGGLELLHPMVEMFGVELDGCKPFEDLMEADKERYTMLKEDWDIHHKLDNGSFMTMESYTS
ncbi:hypothetical protein H0H87_001311, partial [Tephrocybe sp. NHM501043]